MNQGDIDPQVAELMRAASLDAARAMSSRIPALMQVWSKELLFHTMPLLRFEGVAYHV